MINNNILLQLTKEHQTPFYIYNGNEIEKQYFKLKKAFSKCSNFQINYAMKALNTIGVLQFIQKLGASVDTVSLNEVKIALLAGFKPHQIGFTPNGTPFNEIIEAAELGVHVTLDNSIQLKKYAALQNNIPIGIRINPVIIAGGNDKIIVAHKASKFGLALNKINDINYLIEHHNLKIDGFHIHLGSDVLNLDAFKKSADVLFSVAKNFKNLKYINFGGGFKVKYKDDDTFLDIDSVGNHLTDVFNTFQKDYTNDLKLIIEPGKFLVSNAGVFISEITTIKDGIVFVNSGFNHFGRPMYYNAFHQIRNISNTEKSLQTYAIVGNICEQDTFGKHRDLGKPKVGDIICMENAGAYSFSMASNYNSRLKPMELFYYNSKTSVIRKKENFDDLLRNQIY
ncbi:MAG: diaminopimelate decarboxylase [Flavobacteriaceae bacterium]